MWPWNVKLLSQEINSGHCPLLHKQWVKNPVLWVVEWAIKQCKTFVNCCSMNQIRSFIIYCIKCILYCKCQKCNRHNSQHNPYERMRQTHLDSSQYITAHLKMNKPTFLSPWKLWSMYEIGTILFCLHLY